MDTRSKQEIVKPIPILNWALADLKFNFQKGKWKLANVIQTEIVRILMNLSSRIIISERVMNIISQ